MFDISLSGNGIVFRKPIKGALKLEPNFVV